MTNKKDEQLQESINICKIRLKTLLPHLTDEKHGLNETFNKLLIEKAILRDKMLNKNTSSFLKKLLKKIKTNKRELICDYFK